nr:MAG TPA: homing endonuclease [Caudoviricetes sp.]
MEFKSVNDKYEISNTGVIRNKKTKKILKQQKDKDGYLTVNIPTQKFIHRLVAEAFIPYTGLNPDGRPIGNRKCINHKDENKENNSVENLEWCDDLYNKSYSGTKIMCIETNKIYTSYTNAERELGIYPGEIRKVVNTKYRAKYHWKTV